MRMVAKWKNYIIYLLVSVSLVLLLTLLLHRGLPDYRKVTNDGVWYLTNAGLDYWNIGVSRPNYCYRNLVSVVAKCLPVHVDMGFAFISLSATSLYLLAIAIWMRAVGLSTFISLTGLLIVGTQFYPTVYFVQNPFLVDSVLHLFWMLGIIAIFYDSNLLFALIVLVGILNHEAVFFLLIPFWLAKLTRTSLVKATGTAIATGTAASLIYLVHTSNHVMVHTSEIYQRAGWLIGSVLRDFHEISFWVRLRQILSGMILAGTFFYPLSALRALRPDNNVLWSVLRPISLGVLLFVLPYLPMAVGTGRVLNYLIPIWLPWFLLILSRLSKRLMFTVVLLVLIGNTILSTVTVLEFPGEMILRVIGLLLVAIGAFICWRVRYMWDGSINIAQMPELRTR